MSESIETRIAALEAEVKALKERCENFALCHLDNHEDMRRLAQLVNEYQGQLQREGNEVANQIVASVLAQCNEVLERAQSNVQEIAAATKASLSPEKLAEATAAVTPKKIAEALSQHVLVTRPATRDELRAGTAVAVRQASRSEK